MARHQVPLGPASATCLQHVCDHWAGSPPNEIVASALGTMVSVDDVRRSGGDVVAGVERRGRPKTVITIDPCRQYEYVGEDLRHAVLDLNLGAEAAMHLGRLCAYVGPDGVSRSRSIEDVVRDAIWTARWVADVFSHNYRARESERLLLWWDRQPGNPDLRARDRWMGLSPAEFWRVPKKLGAIASPAGLRIIVVDIDPRQ